MKTKITISLILGIFYAVQVAVAAPMPDGTPCDDPLVVCQSGNCSPNAAGQYVCSPSSQAGSPNIPQNQPGGTPGVPGLPTPNQNAAAACTGTVAGGVCFPGGTGLPDPSGGVKQVATNLLNWLLGIFTTVAIIAFVISGFQYLTSAGDDKQIETAKRNMTWSIIGVLVGLSGYVILLAVNAALTGTSPDF